MRFHIRMTLGFGVELLHEKFLGCTPMLHKNVSELMLCSIQILSSLDYRILRFQTFEIHDYAML